LIGQKKNESFRVTMTLGERERETSLLRGSFVQFIGRERERERERVEKKTKYEL